MLTVFSYFNFYQFLQYKKPYLFCILQKFVQTRLSFFIAKDHKNTFLYLNLLNK
ncbi:hypothetical protein HMPREF3203_01691 [Proteus mirabilis]|nr:hypothetical protein HMPREF3203_01691 [Proteus mirabilis]